MVWPDRQTHGSASMTSAADAGGNETTAAFMYLPYHVFHNLFDLLTSNRRDVIMSHHRRGFWFGYPKWISSPKITFPKLVTLIFDLWASLSNFSEILTRCMHVTNFLSIHQTVQPWEHWQLDTCIHKQTGRTCSVTSTTEAEYKNTTFTI